ncbi:MAG: four helix bundle protein [Cyclobacteriaceae bacterium]
MATIRNFKDIEAWQMSRELSHRIYQATYKEPFSKDFALKDQIRRSSGSIMDNIAEGFERNGRREFIQFLSIAKGSAGELRSQLVRAKDSKYISTDEFNLLDDMTTKVSGKIGAFMNYLKESSIKGSKFKQPETLNT